MKNIEKQFTEEQIKNLSIFLEQEFGSVELLYRFNTFLKNKKNNL